jgi:RHH-type proline utilization regulon transcriptional repressor/proline dehydrogenase/delta 1-pyrroline-5-carboxylate dehydrogenase
MIKELGGTPVIANWEFDIEMLATLDVIGGVIWWGDDETGRAMATALSRREGAIIPLITGLPDRAHACSERHICIDTTAAGGNASLLAGGH